jgi:hypothetical protein
MSHTAYVLLLRNIGPRCRLGGYPALDAVRDGRAVPLTVAHRTYFGDLSETTIATGEQGQLWFESDSSCRALTNRTYAAVDAARAANTYSEVVMTLPGGRGSLTLGGEPIDVACGLGETQLGLPPYGPGRTGTPDDVTVTMALPGGAPEKIGNGVFRYTVRLFDGMVSDIALDTVCPHYTVTLAALPGDGHSSRVLTRQRRPLDCATLFPIAPGSFKRLSLDLPLPEVSRVTTVRFKWFITPPQDFRIDNLIAGVGTLGGSKELLRIKPLR